MVRIFKDSDISVKGKILPIERFRLFSDRGEMPRIEREAEEKLLLRAEEALSEPIPSLLLSDYRSYFITGSRAPFDPKYQRRRTMLVELALGEYIRRDGRYLEKLADVIFEVLEESSWVLPAHTGHSPELRGTEIPEVYRPDQLHGIDLRSAATAAILAGVYYLVKDRLDTVSPIIAKRIRYEVLDRTVRPYLQHEFSWGGAFGGLVNNWCPVCVGAVLFVTALLEEDTERREGVVLRAIRHLDNFTAACPEAGGCDEGPGYWEGAAGALFQCLEILYDMSGGAIDLLSHPFVRAMGEYEPRMHIGGARFAAFSDCSPNTYLDHRMLYRYGTRCNIPSLADLGRLTAAMHLNVPKSKDFFAYAFFYSFLRGIHTAVPTVESEKIRFPLCAWQSDLSIAVFREREDLSGLYFAIKGGNNAESHNHNDVGSFVLYKDGAPVLIDAGSGVYTKKTFSPERYTIWNMSSEYHNLPMIGGYGQHVGKSYASKNEVYDGAARTVSMELSAAYDEKAPLCSFERSVRFLGNCVALSDRLSLSESTTVEFRFLTTERPTLIGEGKISLPQGMTLSFDPALSFEAVAVETESYNPASFGTDALYQIRLCTKTAGGSFTFVFASLT